MSNRFIILSLGLAATLAPVLHAEAPAADVKTAGYHLKTRSVYAAPASGRVPFWPIGWAPASKQSATQVAAAPTAFTLKPEQFNVTSILLGSQSLAVINGRTYGEGETLKSSRGLRPTADGAAAPSAMPAGVKIRVVAIVDGAVTLQAGTQSINVQLNRPELLQHKPSGDPLAEPEG